MIKVLIVLFVLLLVAGMVPAQSIVYSGYSYNHFIPRVAINDRSTTLQESLAPNLYKDRSARRDMQWVARNDSMIVEFWNEMGDTTLHILCELSGIEWRESEFDIYLVRYYPSLGSSDPLILPIGGFGVGDKIEAAPSDNALKLGLVFQLSRRMLAQSIQPENAVYLNIAYHPLMRPGPYRLDNMAMLLALATSQSVLGFDATHDAWSSAFWKHHTPGQKILQDYLLNEWILTPTQPLSEWIAAEPYGSQLVTMTRPPKKELTSSLTPRLFVEGLPSAGRLGFSATLDESGYLVVQQIDQYRLAFACGLREGDRIVRVEGYRVRSHKDFVEKVLGYLERAGASIEIFRDGQPMMILIQEMELPDLNELDLNEIDSEGPPLLDSLYLDDSEQ